MLATHNLLKLCNPHFEHNITQTSWKAEREARKTNTQWCIWPMLNKCAILGHTAFPGWSTSKFVVQLCLSRHWCRGLCKKKSFLTLCVSRRWCQHSLKLKCWNALTNTKQKKKWGLTGIPAWLGQISAPGSCPWFGFHRETCKQRKAGLLKMWGRGAYSQHSPKHWPLLNKCPKRQKLVCGVQILKID